MCNQADIEAIVDMWRYVRSMSGTCLPNSLTEWLKGRGGIKDEGGMVRHMMGDNKRPGLVTRRGMSLDDAALAAWEMGFLSTADRPTIDALLDAIERDLNGDRVHADTCHDEADEILTARAMADDLDRLGLTGFRSERTVRAYLTTLDLTA